MRINKIILLFFLCLSFNLYANENTQVEDVRTKKGLKFLFVENNSLPKVSLNITFKEAGYAYENAEKQGLSYFTSFVIQEGSGKNDAKKFAKILEDKGMRLNFNTGLENFTVSLDTLSENLEEGISLLSDAIMRPKVDVEGLNRVLEMLKVQINYLEKDPHFIAARELDKLLFKKHPYSKSDFGTIYTIQNITRDDILTYIKRNFAKDNIMISVVGSTTKEEVTKLLDKYLSKLPSKRSKVKKIPIKDNFSPPESKQIFMDIPQSVIFFAQKGIAYDDPNYYNAIVLINALGGMSLNSVLMRELRQNLGITYSINASILNNKHGNIIAGALSTDNSTADQAISAVKDVFNKVKKEGLDEQLFKDTKVSVINSYIFSMFNNDGIIAKLDNIQANNRDINRIYNFSNYINDVKLEEVNELVKSLLNPEDLFFVAVGKRYK